MTSHSNKTIYLCPSRNNLGGFQKPACILPLPVCFLCISAIFYPVTPPSPPLQTDGTIICLMQNRELNEGQRQAYCTYNNSSKKRHKMLDCRYFKKELEQRKNAIDKKDGN